MFLGIANFDIKGAENNDSQSFLVLDSFLAENEGGMFIQLDNQGYLNKGQMHVKATLEQDHHKSFLIQIDSKEETIGMLKLKIGEKMGSTYELYKGLTELKASRIRKKAANSPGGNVEAFGDSDKVSLVLSDNEEVYFELESKDIWLQVAFQMFTKSDAMLATPLRQAFSNPDPARKLMNYGVTEIRVEKQQSLDEMKKVL